MQTLIPELLTRAEFAPFGDVIDLLGQDSRPRISLFLSRPVELPLEINALERHPLGSQAFMPLHGERFLVVVAPASEAIDPSTCSVVVN